MPEVVWDQLAKKIDDKTTISEEIDADLLTHNEDPSAHKQSGEAIDTHRVAEILDHLDGSVAPAKLTVDKQLIQPSWESWDMLTINTDPDADVDMQMGALQLEHLDVSGNAAIVTINGTFDGIRFATRHPHFETIFYTAENYASDIYVLMGEPEDWCAGWKIVNDTLYACWYADGVMQTYELPDIYVGILHHYRVDVISSTEIEFYVDGELVHHVTDATYGAGQTYPFIYFSITSTDDYVGSLRVFATRFWQDT